MPEFFGYPESQDFLFAQERTPLPEDGINRQAMLAAIIGGPEVGAQVQAELQNEGQSRTIKTLQEQALERNRKAVEDDVAQAVADPNLPPEAKREAAKKAVEAIDSARAPTMLEQAKELYALQADATDRNGEAVQQWVAEHVDAQIEYDRKLRALPGELSMNGNLAQYAAEFTASGFLPGWNVNLREVINEAVPGFVGPTEVLPWPLGGTGDFVRRFKEHLDSLPQEEKVETLTRLYKAVEENNFYGYNSDFQKWDLITTLTEDVLDSRLTDQIVNNVIGVMDIAALGIFRTAGKMGAKLVGSLTKNSLAKAGDDAVKAAEELILNTREHKPVGSPARALDAVAPEEAKVAAETILADTTGAAGKALGATKEQVTNDSIMPKRMDDELTPAPDLNDLNQTILDIHPTRAFYTEEELKVAETNTDLIMQSLEAASPRAMLNKLQVEVTPDGYIAKYHITDTATRGFSTLKLAEETAKTFKVYDPNVVTILARTPEGQYIPVDEARKFDWFYKVPKKGEPKGEYIIEVNAVEYLGSKQALGDTPVFNKNHVTGKLASWVDKSSVFVRWLTRAGNVAADMESAKVKALAHIMEPMTKLKAKDQNKVIQALDDGDRYIDFFSNKAGKWWTDEELMLRWADDPRAPELIAAYRATQRHQQAVHKMLNDRTYRQLKDQGYHHIHLPTETFGVGANQLGKYVSRNQLVEVLPEHLEGKLTPQPITRIYDSKSNTVIPVSKEALDAMNEMGAKFIQFRSPVKYNNEYVQYAMVRGGKLEVRELPKQVLRNIDGYISRIYDAPYILKLKTKSLINGRQTERLQAVRMYATKGEAERDALRMNMEAEEGTEFIAVEAKELRQDVEFANRSSLDYLEYSGQLFTSHRGLEVKGLDGSRRLRSVAESIEAARARAARAQTIDPLVDKLTANWEKKYGAKYGQAGRMPWNESDIKKYSQDIAETADFKDAIAFHRHIKLIAGVDDTMTTEVMRNMMVGFSDYLSTRWDVAPINDLAAWAARNRNRSPINAVKGAAFTHFIIFNPIRQLLLQSQQMSVYLGLDHGLKYFLAGRGVQDFGALIHGTLWRNTERWGEMRKAGAKLYGMDEKEYERFVDAYQKTGLPASIDSHVYAMLSNVDRNLGTSAVWQRPWDYFNRFRKVARQMGFDAGEQFQIMGAFLATRNKWMKNNPKIANKWDTPENLSRIAGEAREISFNMNKTGALQFQKGFLGMMFQFLSHSTKSLQVLIPQERFGKTIGKLSNKAFSDKEKARIAVIQLGLYGTGGFGANEMFEDWAAKRLPEMPPDFMMMAQEGIAGTIANMAIRAAVDQEGELQTDLELSQSMAPFSGIGGRQNIIGMGNPFGVIADALFMSDKTALEMLGPVTSLGSKMKEAWDFTLAISGMGLPEDQTSDQVVVILDEWARQLFPIYNNFIRGRAEATYGYHVSNAGNRGVFVSDGEAWARGFMGANTRRQRQVSEELIHQRGLLGNPKEEAISAELDDAAAAYYKYIKRSIELVGDGKADAMQVMDIIVKNGEVMKQILAPDEHRYFFNRVRKEIYSDVNNDGTEATLVENLTKIFGKLPSVYDEEYMTKLKNYTDFPGKDEALNYIEEMKQWQTTE